MTQSELEDAIDSIGVDELPSSLGENRRSLAGIFARQICDGRERFSNPYFTNDRGHNVGKDVMNAASEAARQLRNLPAEPAADVLDRILARLGNAKTEYQALNADPAGYGAATFGEIMRGVRKFAERL